MAISYITKIQNIASQNDSNVARLKLEAIFIKMAVENIDAETVEEAFSTVRSYLNHHDAEFLVRTYRDNHYWS